MSGITVTVHQSIGEIAPQDWDACACPEAGTGRPLDPFTTHRFLLALEQSGSVGVGTGWQTLHLAARQEGRIVAVAPLYAKSHSQGEYVFDHAWADAWERAGGRYYPKLQMAVPFTPVTGRRFLALPGFDAVGQQALTQAALQLTERLGASSLHVTFCTEAEADAGKALGLLHRVGEQYHWHNQGYASFDDFLAALASRKRKAIRKERAVAQAFGGRILALTGDAIRADHWDALWSFYQDTGSRKWGRPYLTRAFFDLIHQTMRDDVLLILAERDGCAVAGALNFIGREALYGRYWGATEDHPCLHFECCYYQAIDFAITHHLARVEAGAQGEHKIARGYLPVATHSLHHMRDPGLSAAIARYLRQERAAVEQDICDLREAGPFRHDMIERD